MVLGLLESKCALNPLVFTPSVRAEWLWVLYVYCDFAQRQQIGLSYHVHNSGRPRFQSLVFT